MNELLFEAYRVQSVNYGLDALFSAYANHIRDNGLIVSSGRTTTTVIPLVNGRGFLDNAKRLSWGGIPATDFLLRLMQLMAARSQMHILSAVVYASVSRP